MNKIFKKKKHFSKRKGSTTSKFEKNKKVKKIKKSPLSRINETLSDNVILLDSSIENSIVNTGTDLSERKSLHHPETKFIKTSSETVINSGPSESSSNEIIVLDDDDDDNDNVSGNDIQDKQKVSNASFMEMESYHNAFSHGESSTPPVNSNLLDSIICIDDDDTPGKL